MKKLLKLLKWTGISLLILLLMLSVTVALRQNMKYEAPYPDIKASADTNIIARGKQLVLGPAHCVNCHGPNNADSLLAQGLDVPLHGGHEWKLPFGSIYARNITPDAETGIGNMQDKEIARILRYGVNAKGNAVLDFMPFHNMSDEDLTAVISYLRAQKPVVNKVPDHQFNVMGKVIKAFMVKPHGPTVEVPKSVVRDSSVQYGEYLTMSVANCNGCHTQRSMTGEYIGAPFAGGNPIPGEGGMPALTPPNISGDSASRIQAWDETHFINRFRKGKIIEYSHMPWTAYGNMSDNDLKAIFKYLKSVRANEQAPQIAKR